MGQNFSPLRPMRQLNVDAVFSKSQLKVNFEKTIPFFHWEIFVSCTRRDTMLQHHIIGFLLYYLWSCLLREVKNVGLKVVAVVYERWLLTRGSKYSDLTWKHLVCCLLRGGGRLRGGRGFNCRHLYIMKDFIKETLFIRCSNSKNGSVQHVCFNESKDFGMNEQQWVWPYRDSLSFF